MYDKVRRGKVFETIKDMDKNDKLTKLVKMPLADTEYKVTINHINLVSGKTWDRDSLSAIIFNIVLDATVRESGIQIKETMYIQRSEMMEYPEGIVIKTKTE